MHLIHRIITWRKNKKWTPQMQLDRLRDQIQEDARWMAHDPKVVAICNRYNEMLDKNWMSKNPVNVGKFRVAIGADPHSQK